MASDLTERKRRRESEEGKNDQTVHTKRDKTEASRYVCYFVELLDSCYTVVFLLLFFKHPALRKPVQQHGATP